MTFEIKIMDVYIVFFRVLVITLACQRPKIKNKTNKELDKMGKTSMKVFGFAGSNLLCNPT